LNEKYYDEVYQQQEILKRLEELEESWNKHCNTFINDKIASHVHLCVTAKSILSLKRWILFTLFQLYTKLLKRHISSQLSELYLFSVVFVVNHSIYANMFQK
jgi:hypothetical protein